jgi:type IV secretion system protein VirB9
MKIKLALLCLMLSMPAFASHNKKFLTLEKAAMEQAKKWQQTGTAKPIMSDEGKILYPFGQYLPTLTCAPLRACDIELEPGEMVTGKPLSGDSVRWKITKAESGTGESTITHIVVKPIDINIETNMIITTNKRTYHIRLFSSADEENYLNRVGFYYPEDIAHEWDTSAQLAKKSAQQKDKLVVSELQAVAVDQLDFAYQVKGKTPFTPVRVFNDGTRVFIQMPKAMFAAEAPILLLLDENDKPQIVNYRVKDAYYIVDKLFDKAVLLVGESRGQQKVNITWNKNYKKRWFQ